MGIFSSRPRQSSRASSQANFSNVIATGVPVATGVATNAASVAASPGSVAVTSNVNPSDSDARLAIAVSADKIELASDAEHTLTVMLSIKAPAAPDEVIRPPIDLVACIDRSGSMHGEKMHLMKKTLELLVRRAGLKSDDRISLVSFDSSVKLEVGLTAMDADGRVKAESVVKGLQPGNTTNLSGGALKAIDVLGASEKTKEGRSRAVLLFTDGLANEGIRDPDRLQQAVAGALSAASSKLDGPISLYTFGFGADHNETCLRNLASASGVAGQYYYVSTAEDIPNAFADCLGGLTSVVAQNATLRLETLGSAVAIKRVLGNTYSRDADGALTLGDLFAEDEKDVLIELQLPRLPAPLDAPTPVLTATLHGFNVVRAAPETVDAHLAVARPATTPAGQPVNLELDAQRNRILMAEQMEAASRMADQGDLAGGRAALAACRQLVNESASAEVDLSSNLMMQCAELEEAYESQVRYRAVGSKMSKMHARSAAVQRANHSSAPMMFKSGAKRKAALKSSWMSSIMGDSDSD